MKANELRIGNYISRLDLVDIHKKRIEQILELGKKATTTGSLKVISNYEDLIPIPLTEEWLIKFGFKNTGEQFFNVWKDKQGIITFQKDLSCYVGLSHYEAPPLFVECKYVHTLQNLYFALTGEELTID